MMLVQWVAWLVLIGGLGGWFLPKYFFSPIAASTGNPASIFWILLGLQWCALCG